MSLEEALLKSDLLKPYMTAYTIILSSYDTWRNRTLYNEAEEEQRLAIKAAASAKSNMSSAATTTALGNGDQPITEGAQPTVEGVQPTIEGATTVKPKKTKVPRLTEELKLMRLRLKSRFTKSATTRPTNAAPRATDAAPKDAIGAAPKDATDANTNLEEADAVSLLKKPASTLAGKVSIIVLDKGYKAKEMNSLNFLSVIKVQALKHIIMSATPISNRVKNLGAFLEICVPHSVRSDTSWVDGDSRALHPTPFGLLLYNGIMGPAVAPKVLPKIFSYIFIKHTASTTIEILEEYGGNYVVGEDIPPFLVRTLQNVLPSLEQEEHNVIYRRSIPHLYKPPGSAGPSYKDNKKPTVRMDYSVMRQLQLASFSPFTDVLLENLGGQATHKDFRHITETLDKGAAWLIDQINSDPYTIAAPITDLKGIARYLAKRCSKLRTITAITRAHVHARAKKIIIIAQWPAA
ncbi:hypothetical protein H2201_008888 [Coniosporium apollinis]|uniref:SNF2 N-terminal domain-containing protein n=1 Tax=Coniosporium apollinis TaxID=61459 RepID=A0ABQ9NF52_9PEZI|nr:hypothetical protein H2201_008888 [Coniosporium apollinis]